MLTIQILIGTLLGFLSGLGTGGGSLLILYLTLLQDIPQSEAKAINLLFFIPPALLSCLLRRKQGQLPIKKVLPAILAGSIVAAIFSFCIGQQNAEILRKLFGVLLLFTGFRELFFKPKRISASKN